MAKIIEVIFSESTRGKGIEGDPVRKILELWSKDGTLLVTRDAWSGDSWINHLIEKYTR